MEWKEYTGDKRYDFPMDYTFLKKVFSIGKFSYMKRIRIVQYLNDSTPKIQRMSYVGISDSLSKWPSNLELKIQRYLNFLLEKHLIDMDVRTTKFMKYPFIKSLFKDIVRDEKLKSLGI